MVVASLIWAVKRCIDTFLVFAPVFFYVSYCLLRALLCDHIVTLLVCKFHVIPPECFFILFNKPLMKACFSQVLLDDLFSLDIVECVFCMVWCAVFAIAEAFFFLVSSVTVWTTPCDIAWMEVNESLKFLRVFIEFFNECQCFLVV